MSAMCGTEFWLKPFQGKNLILDKYHRALPYAFAFTLSG
jgi:hypothetical protein